MYDKFPEKFNIGNVQYIRADKALEQAVRASSGGEELTVQEVCPVYRLGQNRIGASVQFSNLALSFTTMPVTKIKPGMKLALRVVQ